MLLDLTGDQRGRPDGGEVVAASAAPPSASSSSAATAGGRSLLLGVDLGLVGVVVDVVMALERESREELVRGEKPLNDTGNYVGEVLIGVISIRNRKINRFLYVFLRQFLY